MMCIIWKDKGKFLHSTVSSPTGFTFYLHTWLQQWCFHGTC